jgi:hypothetical protein
MDMVAITDAEQPMAEDAWDALQNVMDNQYLSTADEKGVTVWEDELDITPQATDTLEERKERIKALWIYGILYTYRWLQDWLKNAVGETYPKPVVSGYTLSVTLPVKSDYMTLFDALRRYIPANMVLDESILLTQLNKTIYVGTAFRRSQTETMQGLSWDYSNIVFLCDEDNAILRDGAGYILFEEAMV